ncbi:hypothetical protein BGW38_009085 [Lunasporangiospora selenospora]|uniref:Ferredoxin n=1 Tax=Lunasporangiospora selenospora TaxID=979761 RepID=A0A9P6FY83_9FUNG|nr:hypothetical protein BGW38_009085 [Lunasporangiospora selenospora]
MSFAGQITPFPRAAHRLVTGASFSNPSLLSWRNSFGTVRHHHRPCFRSNIVSVTTTVARGSLNSSSRILTTLLSSGTRERTLVRGLSTTVTPPGASPPAATNPDEEPIQGSAPVYSRHLLICTGVPGQKWAAKPELADPYHNLLMSAVRGQNVKVNWADLPSDSLEHQPIEGQGQWPLLPTKGPRYDLLLYPDNVKLYGLRAEAFRDLNRFLEKFPLGTLRPMLEKQIQEGEGSNQDDDSVVMELIPGSEEPIRIELNREPSAVLVCVHGARDCRCGDRGGDFYKILKDMVEMTGLTHSVKVLGVSHIGGHKYAPNTIMYPSGDWHGNLSERDSNDAQQILFDALSNGGIAAGVRENKFPDPVMIEKWRGRMGLSKEEQVQLYQRILEKQSVPLSTSSSSPQSLFADPGEELYEDDGLKEQANAMSIESEKQSEPQAASPSTSANPTVKVIFETFQKVRTEIDAKVGERIYDIVKDKDPSRHGVYQALECTCGGQLGMIYKIDLHLANFNFLGVQNTDGAFFLPFLECATCHVYIEEPFAARLPGVTDAEEDMLEYAVGRRDASRLGCQVKVTPELEGMVIKLPQY